MPVNATTAGAPELRPTDNPKIVNVVEAFNNRMGTHTGYYTVELRYPESDYAKKVCKHYGIENFRGYKYHQNQFLMTVLEVGRSNSRCTIQLVTSSKSPMECQNAVQWNFSAEQLYIVSPY